MKPMLFIVVTVNNESHFHIFVWFVNAFVALVQCFVIIFIIILNVNCDEYTTLWLRYRFSYKYVIKCKII